MQLRKHLKTEPRGVTDIADIARERGNEKFPWSVLAHVGLEDSLDSLLQGDFQPKG